LNKAFRRNGRMNVHSVRLKIIIRPIATVKHYATDNKAIVDHTSPALCTPITLFPADHICSERLQCIVNGEENPQNCPFTLGFRHPAGGGPSHGRRQHAQKLVKIARVAPEISLRMLSDRQTDRHTDMLITIPRHCSRGRSNQWRT